MIFICKFLMYSRKMDPARRKALGRSMPKKSKRNQSNRTGKLLARQSRSYLSSATSFALSASIEDKTWLETHLWHAKRMHMDNMWGYRLVRIGNMHHVDELLNLIFRLPHQPRSPFVHRIELRCTVQSFTMHLIKLRSRS